MQLANESRKTWIALALITAAGVIALVLRTRYLAASAWYATLMNAGLFVVTAAWFLLARFRLRDLNRTPKQICADISSGRQQPSMPLQKTSMVLAFVLTVYFSI